MCFYVFFHHNLRQTFSRDITFDFFWIVQIYLFRCKKKFFRSRVKEVFSFRSDMYLSLYLSFFHLLYPFWYPSFPSFTYFDNPANPPCDIFRVILRDFPTFWEINYVDICAKRCAPYAAKSTALLRRGGARSIDRSTEGGTPLLAMMTSRIHPRTVV